jgi:membrane protease YdiL (CAAX protease family)
MRQGIVQALLIALVLAFFCQSLQRRLRAAFQTRPWRVWLTPLVLTAIFICAAVVAHALSLPLALCMLAYTAAPVLCVFLAGTDSRGGPRSLDGLAVLLLWLPIEFSAGAGIVPRPAQSFLHSVAYGIAILLGLTLFLCFRGSSGMKYNLPRGRDLRLALVGFALSAPVLIAVGIAIGFIPPPHLPTVGAGRMAAAVGLIFVATALPEEILFRSLIQNFIVQRWGESGRTLFVASLIFGCAHLNNGPQPLPNWRYMILATIAGVAYGKVFQKSTSVTSSAVLHMLVDWTKHWFF